MENLENNKLIAEFMGMNIVTLDDIRRNKNPMISNADGYTVDSLQYHTSWDWLMPVVDEIESIEGISIRIEGFSVEVLKGTMPYEDNEDVVICKGDVDIRKGKIYSVYTAVVEFIKKQNKNNDGNRFSIR